VEEKDLCITYGDTRIVDCMNAVVIPAQAMEESGYIKTFTSKGNAYSKHEFHALTQVAYFQYQDNELECKTVQEVMIIERQDVVVELSAGMVLIRDVQGDLYALVHEGQNRKKLLEAGYRFCTRWVRLDI
jgi:hypothetical protein